MLQDAHAAAVGEHAHGDPHEASWVMLVPLIILAVLCVVGGWVGVPEAMGGSNHFEHFLAPVFAAAAPATATETAVHESASTELMFSAISVLAALIGFLAAWFLYQKRTDIPAKLAKSAGGFYTLVLDKYRIDELYGAVFIKPLIAASTNIFWKGIDRGLIDGAVDNGAAGAQDVSDEMRRMQSGNIRSYAGWVAVGAAAVIAFMVWRGVR
jgi:NADH-quinone oxidoreductase subunit L